MAEVDVSTTASAVADAATEALGRLHETITEAPTKLETARAAFLEDRVDALFCLDAVVGVDEQASDAGFELSSDATLVLGEEPATAVGGRHRVVSAREGDLGECAIAELCAPVTCTEIGDRLFWAVYKQCNPYGEPHDGCRNEARDGDPRVQV